MDLADTVRHSSWSSYLAGRRETAGRLLLLTTSGDMSHLECAYRVSDTLVLGRESGGVPPEVAQAADIRLRVPMRAGARSLNVAMTAALVIGEALRQTSGFPAQDRLREITGA